jgi:heme exporter protein D
VITRLPAYVRNCLPHLGWRFTLRALAIAVTVIAIWCGWIVHVVREREATLKYVESVGARDHRWRAKTVAATTIYVVGFWRPPYPRYRVAERLLRRQGLFRNRRAIPGEHRVDLSGHGRNGRRATLSSPAIQPLGKVFALIRMSIPKAAQAAKACSGGRKPTVSH